MACIFLERGSRLLGVDSKFMAGDRSRCHQGQLVEHFPHDDFVLGTKKEKNLLEMALFKFRIYFYLVFHLLISKHFEFFALCLKKLLAKYKHK